jgi:hypothetical protein
MSTRLDPASFAKALLVESSDIPADMTLAQWRTERRSASQASRRGRRRVPRILRKRRSR